MKAVLDVHPQDFQWAKDQVKIGRFVFVASGDPALPVALSQGIAFVRKDIGPKWAVKQYDDNGQPVTVPVLSLVQFMQDTGVQQFEAIRLGRDADEILNALPGPIARTIIADGLSRDTENRLLQWYGPVANVWTLKERAV